MNLCLLVWLCVACWFAVGNLPLALWVYCGLGCGFRLIVLLYLILLNLNKIGGR